MLKHAQNDKTTMIEVISFLFFTLFAMILAFFTSAKAFGTPTDGVGAVAPAPGCVVVAPCTSDESVRTSIAFPMLTTRESPRR